MGLTLTNMQSHSAAVLAQIAVPTALGVAALIAGQFGGGFMMLGMAALAALAFYLWWVARLHFRVACPLALPQNIRVPTSHWPCPPAPRIRMLVACVSSGFWRCASRRSIVSGMSICKHLI